MALLKVHTISVGHSLGYIIPLNAGSQILEAWGMELCYEHRLNCQQIVFSNSPKTTWFFGTKPKFPCEISGSFFDHLFTTFFGCKTNFKLFWSISQPLVGFPRTIFFCGYNFRENTGQCQQNTSPALQSSFQQGLSGDATKIPLS